MPPRSGDHPAPPVMSRRQVLACLGGATTYSLLRPLADRATAAPRRAIPLIVITAPTDGTDATAAILQQIADAPDGSTIYFPVGRSQGRYRVDGRLALTARRGLTITGPSAADPATFWTDLTGQQAGYVGRLGVSNRSHWSLSFCTDSVLRNLRVEGPNTDRGTDGYPYLHAAQEPEHAYCLTSSQRISIQGCSADSVYGDGLYVGPENGAPCTDIVVRGLDTRSQGRNGTSIVNVDRALIDGLVVTNGGTGGVDLEPNGSDSVHNVEISNGSFDVRRSAFAALGAREVSNIWIHDNTVSHALASWAMVTASGQGQQPNHDWIIERNQQTFSSSSQFGFTLARIVDATVVGNAVPLSTRTRGVTGVNLANCQGRNLVTGNNFGAVPAFSACSGSAPVSTTAGRAQRPQRPRLTTELPSTHGKFRAR